MRKMASLRELFDQGYTRVCIGCNTAFKPDKVPKPTYEDGHGGRRLEMCGCGCDLIGYVMEGKDGQLYVCRKDGKIAEDSILVL